MKFQGAIQSILFASICQVADAGEATNEKINRALLLVEEGADLQSALKGRMILESLDMEGLFILSKQVNNEKVASPFIASVKAVIDPISGELVSVRPSNIGELVLETIRMRVEGDWPKYYWGHSILNKENVERWLSSRKGLSNRQVQVEAAKEVRRLVEARYAGTTNKKEIQIMQMFKNRIAKIESGGSPDILGSRDIPK